MTTVHDGKTTILKSRKPPNYAPLHVISIWDGAYTKDLYIPDAIDDYNHHMGAVDQADQARATYKRKSRQRRTWRPLFAFLLQTALANAIKLWLEACPKRNKSNQTLEFRTDIALDQMSGTNSIPRGRQEVQSSLSIKIIKEAQKLCNGPSPMIWLNSRACTSCQSSGRRVIISTKRKFGEISQLELNSCQDLQLEPKSRLRRTTYGCTACRVPVCKDPICWQEHLDKL